MVFVQEPPETAPVFDSRDPATGLGCVVTVYQGKDYLSATTPPLGNGGKVAVSGTLKGNYDCRFEYIFREYICSHLKGTGAAGDTYGIASGVGLLRVAGAGFSKTNHLHQFLYIAEPKSLAGVFEITGVPSADRLEFDAKGKTDVSESADGTRFEVLASLLSSDTTPPLVANGTKVTFEKGAGPITKAASVTLEAAGESFELDSDSTKAINELKLDGSALTLSCAGNDGSCGIGVNVFEVELFATDGERAPGEERLIPKSKPNGQRVAARCTTDSASSITIPAEVMAVFATLKPKHLIVRTSQGVSQRVTGDDFADPVDFAIYFGTNYLRDF